MQPKPSSQRMINERRNYFRVNDSILLRYQAIDENSALASRIPHQLKDDPGFSLIRELKIIDQENNKYLRTIGDTNRDLEAYLLGLNRKIDLIAGNLVELEEPVTDQQQKTISLSEGGMSFISTTAHAHDSYLALQITLLPDHVSLALFGKIINCSKHAEGHSMAVSFVQLKDNDRQIIAKHIMQLQLAQRRYQDEG